MKLIMQHNTQIKEMEEKLERLLKEKEQSTLTKFIPLSAVPIAEISTIVVPMTTTAEIPSETPLRELEKTVELAKSMEEMTL